MKFYTLSVSREFSHEGAPMSATEPKDVVQYMRGHVVRPEDLWRENLWAVFCDTKNRILGNCLLSVGGGTCVTIDTKTVCRMALLAGADGVVLVHNHPSGDSKPSKHDIENTDKVKKALSAIGVSFLDHVILADDEYFSFACEKIFRDKQKKAA